MLGIQIIFRNILELSYATHFFKINLFIQDTFPKFFTQYVKLIRFYFHPAILDKPVFACSFCAVGKLIYKTNLSIIEMA